MLSMTHLLLLLSVIIASQHLPAHASETSNDYDYNDEESSRPPDHLEKSTAAPLLPYFKEGQVVVYVNQSAKSVQLDCPVKNYDAQHHVIMWYKDETSVTNGAQLIAKNYKIDDQFTLTIPVENATKYHYSCRIKPSDVRQNITVELQTSKGASIISLWSICIIPSVLALVYRN